MATHSSVLGLGKSHGQRSLVGYSPWGCKESDMTFTHLQTNRYSLRGWTDVEAGTPTLWPPNAKS